MGAFAFFLICLCIFSFVHSADYVSLPTDDPANSFQWFQFPPQTSNIVGSVINQGCTCEIFNGTFYVYGKNYDYWNMSIYSFDFVKNSWNLTYFSYSNFANATSTRWMTSPVHDANFPDKWWMFGGNYVASYSTTYSVDGLVSSPTSAAAGWFNDFLQYDFSTQLLTVVGGSNPPPTRENSPLIRYNNQLWLFGMCGPDPNQDQDLWYYDLDTSGWTQITTTVLPSLARPIGRCGHTFTRIVNTTYALIFGGHYTLKNGYLNDLWKFDFVDQNFTQLNATGVIPLGRAYHIAGYYDGLLLIYSGDGDSFLFFGDLWAYSILNNSWINIIPIGANPTVPTPRMQATGIISDNNFFIYGGKAYGPDPNTGFDISLPLNDLWVFKLGCPNNCSTHGNCSSLICTCANCYSGQDCSIHICSTYTTTTAVGAIVGAVVGGVVGLCLAVGVGAFIGKKANKYKKERMRKQALLSAQNSDPFNDKAAGLAPAVSTSALSTPELTPTGTL